MAEESLQFSDRIWFHDARTPSRRMGVSSHREAGIVIVSLWQGDLCTASFRLPLAEGARLIAAVADGMAAGLPRVPAASPASDGQPPSLSWWRRRLRALVAHGSARDGGPGLHLVR